MYSDRPAEFSRYRCHDVTSATTPPWPSLRSKAEAVQEQHPTASVTSGLMYNQQRTNTTHSTTDPPPQKQRAGGTHFHAWP